MGENRFVHLHLHSQYSLLDGACRTDRLMEKLESLGQTACAITDHGVMYGVVDFYQQCQKHGIHPIIGCEVYVCQDMVNKSAEARESSHLILLCENQTGYHNLCKIVSEAFIHGYYYRPRTDYAYLKEHHEGLIALSACLSGDLPRLLLNGQDAEAKAKALEYLDIFGEGNFFIELQDHGIPEEKQVLPRLVRMARQLKIPLVVTNDCHYINKEDARAQEVLMCIQTGKTLSEENRMRMNTEQLYVKSYEEMHALFPNFDDAFQNTVDIANRCHVDFDFKTRHLPKFPLEEGQTADGLFQQLCDDGLLKRYGPDRPDARARLDYEMGVIRSMGFVDYFLIVWDFIHYARENGILVGPGRGSGAGSIVAYCMFITSIDPLKYNLLFERFLNPERISMPDLDIDFEYERRGEVIDYVARRYGSDHVSQIITFGTMAAKGVLRDVGRVLGVSYSEADRVARMIPAALDMTLDKALKINPEFQKAYDSEDMVRQLVDTARTIEGMPRHASTHAAGVLITSKPVSDYCPLQTNEDVITTQFPMGTVEALGLLKMDFLGLRTLTVIGDSLKMIHEAGGPEMTPMDIPMDDPKVYAMISSGDTEGVFQLESGGMTSFLMSMKPENLEDVIAAISLYRPGPMESIPRYIAGKRKPDTIEYDDEKLRPILDVTYGCMVYQEQVMQIVRDLAGYSLGRSDLVRRAMAKKKHDVMAKEREYFIHGIQKEDGTIEVPGAVRMGVPEAVAEKLFDDMSSFASYAFNKSHAAAYAVVAAQTGWLKVHYPVQFMAALMNSVAGNVSKIAYYIQYCRKKKIDLLPPDINHSLLKFSVENNAIRFGFNAIKSVGDTAALDIVQERTRSGPFRDLFDFINRITGNGINKKVVESLIRTGAFDTFEGNRRQKLTVFESAMDSVAKSHKRNVQGQASMFDDDLMPDDAYRPRLPDLPEFPTRELLDMEKESTGVYISGHPLDDYAQVISSLPMNIGKLLAMAEEADFAQRMSNAYVALAGILISITSKSTKSGGLMGILTLEDLYGTMEVIVFQKAWERLSGSLIPNSAVVLTGKISIREEEDPKLLLDNVILLQPDHIPPIPPRYLQGNADRNRANITDAANSAYSVPSPPAFSSVSQEDMLSVPLPEYASVYDGMPDGNHDEMHNEMYDGIPHREAELEGYEPYYPSDTETNACASRYTQQNTAAAAEHPFPAGATSSVSPNSNPNLNSNLNSNPNPYSDSIKNVQRPSNPIFNTVSNTVSNASPADYESALPPGMRYRPFVAPESTPDSRKLYLRVSGREILEDVARILMAYPGRIRVVFAFYDGTRENAPHNLNVSEKVPLNALQDLLGKENVVLKEPVPARHTTIA